MVLFFKFKYKKQAFFLFVYQPDIYRLPDKGLYINSYVSTNSSPINIALQSRIASPYTALGHVITEQDNKANQINVLLRVLLTINTCYMERSQDSQSVYFGITLYTVWFKLPICCLTFFVVHMIRLRSDTNKYTSRTIYVKQYVYYWCHSHSNHQNQTYALSNQVANVYMGL